MELVQQLERWVLLPVLAQLVLPFVLHGPEDANIQRLHNVGAVGRQAHKLYVVLTASIDDVNRQM